MSTRPNWKEQPGAFSVWLEDLRHGNHVPVTGWHAEHADHFESIGGAQVPKMHEGWAYKVWRKPKRPNVIPPQGFPIWICNMHGAEGDWYCERGDLYQGRDGTLRDKLREGVTFLALYAEPPLALDAPTAEPWTGEGPPPVGTVCEYDARPVGKGDPLWVTVKINYLSEWTIVFVCVAVPEGEREENVGVELSACVGVSTMNRFRPIRTPEQIAMDERKRVVEAVAEELKDLSGPKCLGVLYGLYDLGYLKTVSQ